MPISDKSTKRTDQADNAAEAMTQEAQEALRSAKAFADDVSVTAKEAINTSRMATSNAVHKAQEGIKAVERELSPSIDDLAAKAQELASRSISFCAENSERARRQFRNATEVTTRYVVEQPGKSILLAAAAGAAIATAFLMGSRRR
jgi:ElaB/YqjD/DUF883 family membrane-anchored ribosome-binding protein